MRIVVIGATKAVETKLLFKAARKRGHGIISLRIEELEFCGGPKKIISYRGKDIAEQVDLSIIRGMTAHPDETLLLASYLREKGIRVIDRRLATERYFRTKLYSAFQSAGSAVPYPLTYYVVGKKSRDDLLKKIKYPIIVKEVWGMHGRNVFRFKSRNEVAAFFTKDAEDYIIQEDLLENDYFRVFVVGDKVLGAMKRAKKRPLNNQPVRAGVKSTRIEPNKKLAEVALKSHKIFKNEISGIDIIEHSGKYYMIEANRTPQFSAFSEIVGVNVAEEIVKYMEKTLKDL